LLQSLHFQFLVLVFAVLLQTEVFLLYSKLLSFWLNTLVIWTFRFVTLVFSLCYLGFAKDDISLQAVLGNHSVRINVYSHERNARHTLVCILFLFCRSQYRQRLNTFLFLYWLETVVQNLITVLWITSTGNTRMHSKFHGTHVTTFVPLLTEFVKRMSEQSRNHVCHKIMLYWNISMQFNNW